ncbi:ABC transporter substrate-binding protein [Naumannella halotolerans]|uniref:ABC transporter substrate-binding protein n=1 Tax=Naumannella halotolerans TaxID=993414 RepID=UPI00370D3802
MTAKTITRRGMLGSLAGLGIAATLGCGGPGSTTGGAADPVESGGEITGEVNFYHWRNEDKAILDELAASFVAAHAGVELTQTIDPSEQYQSTAAQKARDGAIGDSLTALAGAQFNQFAELGLFADLSDAAFGGNYEANLITPGASGGSQLGFPYQLIFNMPLLNTDLAERAGLGQAPADWDAWLDALDKLRGIGVVPIAWPGNDPANAFQIINSLVMNHGPSDDMFAGIEDGRYAATDDWWIAALTQFKELSGYFQDNFAGAGVDGVLAQFSQGEAAILPTGSYQIGQVREAGGEFGLEFAPLMTNSADEQPKYEGIFNSTFILGVNSAAGNAAGALAWVEFLSQPENAAVYANGTSQHVTVSGVEYENADLQALAPWATRNNLLAPRFQFLNLDIRSAIENSLVAVATGASPEQAAEQAQKLVEENR